MIELRAAIYARLPERTLGDVALPAREVLALPRPGERVRRNPPQLLPSRPLTRLPDNETLLLVSHSPGPASKEPKSPRWELHGRTTFPNRHPGRAVSRRPRMPRLSVGRFCRVPLVAEVKASDCG